MVFSSKLQTLFTGMSDHVNSHSVFTALGDEKGEIKMFDFSNLFTTLQISKVQKNSVQRVRLIRTAYSLY